MTQTTAVSQALRSLSRTLYRGGRISEIVETLHHEVGADVVLVDTGGSILAAAPSRSSIAADAVLARASGLSVLPVPIAGQVAAHLATNDAADLFELLEFAAALISVALTHRHEDLLARVDAASRAFVEALDSTDPEPSVRQRLDDAGLHLPGSFQMLVGRVDAPDERVREVPWNVHALSVTTPEAPRLLVAGAVVLISAAGAPIEQRALFMLERLRTLGAQARVGVSQVRSGLAGLRIAYLEADDAAASGPGIVFSAGLALAQLTIRSCQSAAAREAAERTLGPLVDYDERHAGHLVQTLETYLAQSRGGGIRAASDTLYVHPNTLRYRLRQIEELTGRSLDLPSDLVELYLAIQLTRRIS